MTFYLCRFCLCETEGERDDPEECPHCHVAACDNCGTFLKEAASICYGCGKVSPPSRASMVRADAFAACYAVDAWCRRNKADHMNGGDEEKYELLIGESAWVSKRTVVDGKYVTEAIRELSEEEKGKLQHGINMVYKVTELPRPDVVQEG